MVDIERWITSHESEMHDLAARTGAHDETVHFLTVLVLSGATDDAIYEHLREIVPSPDGQRSPLRDTPELLAEVRRMVSAA